MVFFFLQFFWWNNFLSKHDRWILKTLYRQMHSLHKTMMRYSSSNCIYKLLQKANLITYRTGITSFYPLKNAGEVIVVFAFCGEIWILCFILCMRRQKPKSLAMNYSYNSNAEVDCFFIYHIWFQENHIRKENNKTSSIIITFKTNWTNILIFFC